MQKTSQKQSIMRELVELLIQGQIKELPHKNNRSTSDIRSVLHFIPFIQILIIIETLIFCNICYWTNLLVCLFTYMCVCEGNCPSPLLLSISEGDFEKLLWWWIFLNGSFKSNLCPILRYVFTMGGHLIEGMYSLWKKSEKDVIMEEKNSSSGILENRVGDFFEFF